MSSLEDQKAQWMSRVLGVDVGLAPGDVAPSVPSEDDSDLAHQIRALHGQLVKREAQGVDRPSKMLDLGALVSPRIRFFMGELSKTPREEKAALLKLLDEMKGLLAKTLSGGMKRSESALLNDLKQAQASVKVAQESVSRLGKGQGNANERKKAYKLASAGATKAFQDETAWQAEIKDGKSLEGIGQLSQPLQDLRKQRELLDDLVAALLPKLNSKARPSNVGEDAVEKAPESHVITKDKAIEIIRACGGDWADAKAKYGRYKDEMSKLALFRKEVVDKWLVDNLQPWGMSKGTGTGWVSVGSDDPTSDYDISINKHGLKGEGRAQQVYFDYQIVQDFNAFFRKEYGCESGTIFDTNLYAAAPPLVPGPPKEGTKQEMEAYEDIKASNDVGALMKQRRYMSADEFKAYEQQILGDLPEGAREQMSRQFFLANANYMISLEKSVEVMREMLESAKAKAQAQEPPVQLSDNQQKALDLIAQFDQGRGGSGVDEIDAPDNLEHVAHQLMHDCKDASTMATNELYATTKADLRKAEINVDTLQKIRDQAAEFLDTLSPDFEQDIVTELLEQMAGALDTLDGVAAGHVRQGIAKGDRDSLLKGVKDALERINVEAPRLLGDLANAQVQNMFYANEAYQSGGPLKHVVYAGQAVESDVEAEMEKSGKKKDDHKQEFAEAVKKLREQRRGELTVSERLESFNEQLGDFLKDLAHYGDEEPGVAIIQSSKYLDRLLDAAGLLSEKGVFKDDQPLEKLIEQEVSRLPDIRGQLIAARKGKLIMEGEGEEAVDQVEQRRALACEFMVKMGIKSVAGLGRTYKDLGIRVNVAARKAMAPTV